MSDAAGLYRSANAAGLVQAFARGPESSSAPGESALPGTQTDLPRVLSIATSLTKDTCSLGTLLACSNARGDAQLLAYGTDERRRARGSADKKKGASREHLATTVVCRNAQTACGY